MIKFKNCNCIIPKGKFDITKLPHDCKATWNLISLGNTIGVFQLESALGQQWSKKVKPQNIEELSDLIAGIRPGVLEAGLMDVYVSNKFGVTQPEYIHPILKPILGQTQGIIMYQEEVLKIANELAGFSLIESDNLRKAIGKKIPELMAQTKTKFLKGCQKKQLISQEEAEKIFGWIEKSQRYLFCRAHSISYAHLSYQTAYLKAHFPHEFFCSYLTYSNNKQDPKEEIYKLIQEARVFNIKILPPNIKNKNIDFEIDTNNNEKVIIFGLSHIRNVGKTAVERIKKYDLSTWNLFLKTLTMLHRDVCLALVKSGACDCYNMSRRNMINQIEIILGTSNDSENKGLTSKEKDALLHELEKTNDFYTALFNIINYNTQIDINKLKKDELKEYYIEKINMPTHKMTKKQMIDNLISNNIIKINDNIKITKKRIPILQNKLKDIECDLKDKPSFNAIAEKEFLGISLTCSRVDELELPQDIKRCIDAKKIKDNTKIKFYAIIDNIKHTLTKKGKNIGSEMCFLTISDSTFSLDRCVVFPDSYKKFKNICTKDNICKIEGYKKDGSFIIQNMQKIL